MLENSHTTPTMGGYMAKPSAVPGAVGCGLASRLLLLAVLWLALSYLADAHPAEGQVLPPCCTTPEIITALSQRPAGETASELQVWLQRRTQGKSNTQIALEISAIDGACEIGCTSNFQLAARTLRETLAIRTGQQDDTDGPACCTGPVKPQATTTAGPKVKPSLGAKSTATGSGYPFRNAILRKLINWTGGPEALSLWLMQRLEPVPTNDLKLLKVFLAGRCTPERKCPAEPYMAQMAIDLILSARDKQDASKREDELRRGDRYSGLVNTLLGALFGFVGGIVALIIGQMGARRQMQANDATLSALSRTLDVSSRQAERSRFGFQKSRPRQD